MLRGNQGISPASSEKAVTNESGHEGNKDWYFCIQTHSVTSIRSLRSQSIDHSVHNFVCIRAGILGKFTKSLFDCEKRKKDINYGLNIIACRTSATFLQFQANGCKREESARRGQVQVMHEGRCGRTWVFALLSSPLAHDSHSVLASVSLKMHNNHVSSAG